MPAEGSPSDVPPAAFGRYRVLHQIGAGSLGPVFRGEDADAHPVAIKLLRINLTPERARQISGALLDLRDRAPRHAAFATLVDAGLHEAEPYYVTSLVTGDSLDVALREFGPAAILDALPRLRLLASALDTAAAVGIWHGSLQPRDVIVSAEDTGLVGLGVAQLLEEIGERLAVRRPYTAPEVADGASTSPAADQFALAAIAHEWLFGRRLAGPAESLIELPSLPGVDGERLASAFTAALAPEPSGRFATSGGFIAAVSASVRDAAGAHRPGAGRASTPAYKPPAPIALPLDEDEEAEELPAPLKPRHDPAAPSSGAASAAPAIGAAAFLPDEPEIEVAPLDSPFGELDLQEPDLSTFDALNSEPAEAADEQEDDQEADDARSRAPVMWQGGRRESQADPSVSRVAFTTETAPQSSARFGSVALALMLVAGIGLGVAIGYGWGWSRADARARASADPAGRVYTDAALPSPAPDATPATAPSTGASASARAESPASYGETSPKRPAIEGRDGGPPAPGRLLVRTTPAGARVLVDGVERGHTPLAVRDLELGTHTVSMTRDGYQPVERRVTLTADRPSRPLEERLATNPTQPPKRASAGVRAETGLAAPKRASAGVRAEAGSLLVESRPAGASVTIDGRALGPTPLTVPSLSPGTHTVRIDRPGYRPWATTVQITEGTRARVAASLVGGQTRE